MGERFISEAITPQVDAFDESDTTQVTVGEPIFPTKFTWRDTEYTLDAVLETWKENKPDATHGSGEMYLKKHWYRITTTSGHTMKIYFDRQPKSKSQAKTRWWLFTLQEPE